MWTLHHALLFFVLAACGADPNATGTEPTTAPADDGVIYQPDDPKEIVVEYRRDGDVYALAVNDTDELPACTHEFNGKLAWIKNTEQFFACEDSTWTEIAVHGRDGKDGEPGSRGEPGRPPSPNEWVDPTTEDRWLFGAPIGSDTLAASTPCADGWRLGTSAELVSAVQRGLSLASGSIGGPTVFWSSEFLTDATDGFSRRVYVNASGVASVFMVGAGPAGVACLYEGDDQ
jgi:hypothetical protein